MDKQIITYKFRIKDSNCKKEFERQASGLSSLGVRDWVCSECGSQHLRDVNAAQNILNFALG